MLPSLGPYVLVEELAGGGQATVYRARHPALGRELALKVLRPNGQAPEAQRERFLREAQALASLAHPHVVRVYEVGSAGGHCYLAMALVSGPSLQDRLTREGPLPLDEAVDLIVALADAVQHAHDAGLLHRDLKPDNVLLDPGRGPVLVDFGLTRGLERSADGLTRTGHFLGTPGYWPPEQALGQLDRITARSDVYGLGAILYAALTGRPPHEPGGDVGAVLAGLEVEPAPPSRERPELPPALDDVCRRCLARDPDERFPSAAALAEAVERAARPPARGRARGAVPGLLAVVGAGAALAVILGRPGAPAPPRHPVAAEPQPEPAASPTARPPAARPPAAEELPASGGGEAGSSAGRAALEEGRRLARASRPRQAIAAFTRALELDPALAAAYAERGAAHRLLGRLEEAQADLDAALALAPDDAGLYVERGVVASRRGDGAAAFADYSRAIELAPGLAAAYANRALVRTGRDGLEAALSDAETAIRIDSSRAHSYNIRGMLRFGAGDLDGADADFTRAIALDPEYALAYSNRGALRERRGELAAALADHDRAVALGPRGPGHYTNRSITHRKLGDIDAAIADATRAIELAPDHADAYESRALAHVARGELDRALADMARAVERDPRRGDYLKNRGAIHLEAGDPAAALRDFRRALDLAPRAAWARQVRLKVAELEARLAGTRGD